MTLPQLIEAILLNNPVAVAENLSTRGILQDEMADPDTLYNGILGAVERMGDREAKNFLLEVLSVPVDMYGTHADLLTAAANRKTLESMMKEDRQPGMFGHQWLQGNVNWLSVLFVLFCLLILALIFRLLQTRK